MLDHNQIQMIIETGEAQRQAQADRQKCASPFAKDERHHPNAMRYCQHCGVRLTDTLFGWITR